MFNNKYLHLSFVICSFIIIAMVGCGQQETTPTTTTTTIPSAGSIALSGQLGAGTISSAGLTTFTVAVPDYSVVAVDNSSGQSYHGASDSAGNFSISVPPGSSYQVSLVNGNAKYFGPVVMAGDSSSSEVVMGITPSTDTNLGTIVVDTSNSYAQPSSAPSAILNSTDTAVATSGVPKGAGNTGKTQLTGITTRSGSDMDKDGIPNLFDADEDNDGIRNGVASTPTAATVTSNTVESVMISSNIWADHGTTSPAQDLIMMRIHVIPKSGYESDIASVECIGVPATINSVAIIWDSSSLGSPTGYPAEGTLWSSVNYNLYKTTTLPQEQWTVLLIPKAIMTVGDVFTVRVHFVGGGCQDFFITTSYVLTDWSKIENYNGTTMSTTLGTNSNPVTYSASSLNIEFSKPLDEDGNILAGLNYSVRYATSEYDAGAGRYLVPSNVTETPVTDSGGSTLSFSFSTVTAETYYVTPVAESSDGQRNGEETWFTKQ